MTTSLRLFVLCLATFSIWPSVAYGQVDSSDSGRSPPAGTDGTKLPWLAATLTAGPGVLGYGIATASLLASRSTAGLYGGLTLGLLGPSAGHIYTGDYLRAGLFGIGRLAFAGIAFVGVFRELGGLEAHEHVDQTEILGLIVAGSFGVLAMTVWESLDSYSSAKAVNRKRKGRAVALSPFIVRSQGTGSSSAAGLLVSGRF